MKSNWLIFGIVLLIIGGVLFMIGYNGLNEYHTTLGQISRAFSHGAQQAYQRYMLMELFGGILALIGFVLSIVGVVVGETPKSK